MKIINNKAKFEGFIEKYKLQSIFGPQLKKHGKLVEFSKGELILSSGDEPEYYYVSVEGRTKIVYPFENGKEMPLKLYYGFESIGDIELMNKAPILCDVISVDKTILVQIPLDIMEKIYLHSPEFLGYISRILSKKLYATIKNVSYSYVYPLANRLATYLLLNMNEETTFKLTDSYKNIAQQLGTSYRHLNRTLKEFEDKGLIRIEKKNVEILNLKKLQSLSKENYMDSF